MIRPPYRCAVIIVLLAAAAAGYYFKYRLQEPSISIADRDSATRSPEAMKASPHFGKQHASPGATLSRLQSRGQEFRWAEKLEDWLLIRERSRELDESTPEAVHSCIWPEESHCSPADRIISQLKLRPAENEQESAIRIAFAGDFEQPLGGHSFEGCNFNKCQITRSLYEADAIVFKDADVSAVKQWPLLKESQLRQRQIWIAYLLESPPNTFDKRFTRANRDGRTHFNWTATYRADSDIVTPYSKFVLYEDALQDFLTLQNLVIQPNNLSTQTKQVFESGHWAQKRDKVAWFVSNCHARNRRLEYARELSNYIQVDVFGRCGNLTCSKWSQNECLKRINLEYKFYLSFENSNNRDYITEKLYRNALGYNDPEHALLPIVMGPPRSDYERLAPPRSFIHVDDFRSAEELARFLKELSSNKAAYSSYFRWKSLGRFIDTKFSCRLCAMLHRARSQKKVKIYDNLRDWWLND